MSDGCSFMAIIRDIIIKLSNVNTHTNTYAHTRSTVFVHFVPNCHSNWIESTCTFLGILKSAIDLKSCLLFGEEGKINWGYGVACLHYIPFDLVAIYDFDFKFARQREIRWGIHTFGRHFFIFFAERKPTENEIMLTYELSQWTDFFSILSSLEQYNTSVISTPHCWLLKKRSCSLNIFKVRLLSVD